MKRYQIPANDPLPTCGEWHEDGMAKIALYHVNGNGRFCADCFAVFVEELTLKQAEGLQITVYDC